MIVELLILGWHTVKSSPEAVRMFLSYYFFIARIDEATISVFRFEYLYAHGSISVVSQNSVGLATCISIAGASARKLANLSMRSRKILYGVQSPSWMYRNDDCQLYWMHSLAVQSQPGAENTSSFLQNFILFLFNLNGNKKKCGNVQGSNWVYGFFAVYPEIRMLVCTRWVFVNEIFIRHFSKFTIGNNYSDATTKWTSFAAVRSFLLEQEQLSILHTSMNSNTAFETPLPPLRTLTPNPLPACVWRLRSFCITMSVKFLLSVFRYPPKCRMNECSWLKATSAIFESSLWKKVSSRKH